MKLSGGKKLFRWILILLTIVLVPTMFLAYKLLWDPENTKQVYYPMPREEQALLRSGDIIMRHGYGFFSDAIADAQHDSNAVSHCAMVINESGNIKVIHALSSSVADFDGVQEQTLQRFLNESKPKSIVVVRYKTTFDTLNLLALEAQRYSKIQKPFDHNFNSVDTSSFYCTELFHVCFKNALKRDIFEAKAGSDGKPVYDLSTFRDSNLFECIIDHHSK